MLAEAWEGGAGAVLGVAEWRIIKRPPYSTPKTLLIQGSQNEFDS